MKRWLWLLFLGCVLSSSSEADEKVYHTRVAVVDAHYTGTPDFKEQVLYDIGMAELLHQDLRKVPGFVLIDRKKVRQAEQADFTMSAKKIALDLGADVIVQIEYQMINNKKITCRLLTYSPSDQKIETLKEFAGPKQHLLQILDGLTFALAEAQGRVLTKKEIKWIRKQDSFSLKAWLRYAKGMELYYKETHNALILAEEQFNKAEFYDILFLPAYVAEGQVDLDRVKREWGPAKELLDRAHENARKALFLDAEYLEAYELLAEVFLLRGDYVEAVRESLRAIRLSNMSLKGRLVLSQAYIAMGKKEEALREVQKLLEIDPLNKEGREWFERIKSS